MNYNTLASGYDDLHRDEQVNKLQIIATELSITPQTTVLDVGCGTGLSAALNCAVVGVDTNEAMLQQCTFPAILASAEHLPFPTASFDIVISLTMLHHVQNAQQAIQEMKQVGKKHIVISLLRSSPRFEQLSAIITQELQVSKTIREKHDTLFFCEK